MRKAIWNYGIKGYRLHWKKVPGRPDIAFPSKKIAIFANGFYWHRCTICNLALPNSNTAFWKAKFDKNMERDKSKVEQLKQQKWNVLIIWECRIKENIDICVEKISNLFKYYA